MREFKDNWPYFGEYAKKASNKYRGDGFVKTVEKKAEDTLSMMQEFKKLIVDNHGLNVYNDYIDWMLDRKHLSFAIK